MDLDRTLERCRRDPWSANHIDWTPPPRDLSPGDEAAFVQYFKLVG